MISSSVNKILLKEKEFWEFNNFILFFSYLFIIVLNCLFFFIGKMIQVISIECFNIEFFLLSNVLGYLFQNIKHRPLIIMKQK